MMHLLLLIFKVKECLFWLKMRVGFIQFIYLNLFFIFIKFIFKKINNIYYNNFRENEDSRGLSMIRGVKKIKII